MALHTREKELGLLSNTPFGELFLSKRNGISSAGQGGKSVLCWMRHSGSEGQNENQTKHSKFYQGEKGRDGEIRE